MIREVDVAYLAGVVDSDGCIRVDRVRGSGRGNEAVSFAAFVAIQQVESEAVNLAKELFGGYLLTVKPSPKRPAASPMMRWTAKSRIAANAIHVMRPYLRIKARQADNALALQALVQKLNRDRYAGVVPGVTRPRYRTPQELDQLAAYYNESRLLNTSELNPEYAKISEKRTKTNLGLPLQGQA